MAAKENAAGVGAPDGGSTLVSGSNDGNASPIVSQALRLARDGFAVLAIALLPGCAPVLIAAVTWDHIEARKDRKEFVESFNRQNLERETAGLPALDWCRELYNTKPSWHAEDPRCKA